MLNANEKSMNRIIFIAGIHGSGKGTICKQISKEFEIPHFSCSELLKWEEISSRSNKNVDNFEVTQNRLLNGIRSNILPKKLTLLDGHFCLLNREGSPEKIEEQIFMDISPIIIGIVTEDVNTIHERLEYRDGNRYDLHILEKMQELEYSQAEIVSKLLKIPLIDLKSNNVEEMHEFIKKNK